MRKNLLKIANAEVIRDRGLADLVEEATERRRPLAYRIFGLPKEQELTLFNTIKRVLEEHQQAASKKNKNAPAVEEETEWLKMPPPDLVSANHRLLTSLSVTQLQKMYKQSAFDVDAPVFIYNGKHAQGRDDRQQDTSAQGGRGPSAALDDEKLVKIVLSLMEENVWRQKFLAGLDVKEKRR